MVEQESTLTLSEAAATQPGSHGKPVRAVTILRWIKVGVRGVRLEGVRVGGRWITSRQALGRFRERLNS